MNSMAFNVVWFLSVFVFSEANTLFVPSWPNFRCTLYHAVDLGRYLNSDSYYLTEPFVPGNVTTNTLENYTFRLNSFCSGEHVGTHVNAPYQFNENGWTVDEIPLHHLIANGVFMNLTKEAAGNSSFLLQPRHIIDWIRRNGLIPMNSILLVSFGWSQLNRTEYMGTDSTDPSQVRQPAISLEAARMLIDMKKFVGIALDTMSLDVTGEAVIRSFTSAENIYSIEQLLFPTHCLPERGFKVVVMPMKISGTGAPARVIVVPDNVMIYP